MAQGVTRKQAWLMAARPKTLPAAAAGVAVGWGTALADGRFRALPAIACLAGGLLLQIASNVANDYFDARRGIDTPDRRGPVRVTQSGLLPPAEVRAGLIAVIAAAFAVGCYLAAVGGWPIVVVGLGSILALLAYSSGPYPLASHGLGDLFAFLFFGVVAVTGTYYVQAGTVGARVFAAAVPAGALITAIIVVNNLRDIDTDRRVGKRSLAVMIGPRATRLEYLALVAVAYLVPGGFWLLGRASPWVFLPWLSLPLAVRAIRGIHRADDGPAFNRLLAATARLALVFCILFSIGLVPAKGAPQ
jgi:1,4-dihydroxy-2-naphthoate octaprenyltransferase